MTPPEGVRTMAVVRWLLVAVMAVVAGGSLTLFLKRTPGGGSEPAAHKAVYYCPMHPQIVQDHPGDCPICSMRLVVRTAAPAAAGAPASAVPGLVPIEVSDERIQRIGVRTEKVIRQSLAGELRTAGVVEADERRMARVSPRFAGWIEELFVSETGQRVKRGQPLARIYSPEVLQAQQELLTALGWSAGPAAGTLPHHGETTPMAGMVADARRRLELLGISPSEIAAIEQSRKAQPAITLRSPVEGHIIGKNAVAGTTVSPGTSLFEVADLSSVWVVAEVYEGDLPRVRLGQPARFEASAHPGDSFRGKVKFVYPTVDATSRTLRVRLELRNRPGPDGLALRPGMFGEVALDLPATSGLMVPAEAVVDTGDVQYLFVTRPGGRFEPRRIKLGARRGDRIEVLDGVAEGESVVTTANFLIDSESRLRAAIERR